MAGAELIGAIQIASEAAAKSRVPADIVYGEVISVMPLSIKLDEKRTLPEQFFIVPKHLTNYTVDLAASPETAETSSASPGPHTHTYVKCAPVKRYTVMNSLQPGDKVVMVKAQGGQSFLIIGCV